MSPLRGLGGYRELFCYKYITHVVGFVEAIIFNPNVISHQHHVYLSNIKRSHHAPQTKSLRDFKYFFLQRHDMAEPIPILQANTKNNIK
jgi:hypothetical protein